MFAMIQLQFSTSKFAKAVLSTLRQSPRCLPLLDDDKLRRSAEQAEKTIADAIQGWRLKAQLFTLKFRLNEAEKAYETALRYINRETNPQLWAETEVDLGITHTELGIRVEGKAGNEH